MLDYYYRNLPDYYDYMYLDGYTPEEILMAHRKMMFENLKEPEVAEIVIRSEVKVK